MTGNRDSGVERAAGRRNENSAVERALPRGEKDSTLEQEVRRGDPRDSALERALRRGDPGDTDASAGSRGRAIEEAVAAAARMAARAMSEGLVDALYAEVDSPFGKLTAVQTRYGLVRLAFPEEPVDRVLGQISRAISPRILEGSAQLDGVRRELDEYFAGRRREFDLALDRSLMGPFATRVLSATAAIPYGQTSSYASVALEAGSPRGSRAAGNALGSNPIPIVVPCHRVLRSGGLLGGYAGGPERKRRLLELEGAAIGDLRA